MIISVAQTQIYFLALTRVLAIIIHIPVLGGRMIPIKVRLALGILLTAVLVPWEPLAVDTEALSLFGLTIEIGREIIIGTIAGFAASLTFGAVQIAGEAMSTGSGFSAARIMNPAFGSSGSAMDQLFTFIALLLFLVLNGHHQFLIALQSTFRIIPLRSELPILESVPLIRMFADLVTLGIQMALPVMCTMLLTDIVLGLLARIAPQVQVFFLGLPLKISLGIVAFIFTFNVATPLLSDLLKNIGPRMIELLGG